MAISSWQASGTTIAKYRIDAVGETDVRNVWLSHDPTDRLRVSPAEQRTIDERWAQQLATGRRVYDLPLYRLTGWEIHGSRLVLRTGATTYKQFVGTDRGRGAAPLAVSVVTITSDGKAIMHQRSSSVAESGGLWHVTPGGHPHPPDTIARAAWMELYEELAVRRREANGSMRATGLATNVVTGKPDVALALRLRVSADEVLSRDAADRWEYERLEPIEWSAASIARWLVANVERCVPVGHAALLLAGRINFGEGWFRERVAELQQAG